MKVLIAIAALTAIAAGLPADPEATTATTMVRSKDDNIDVRPWHLE